MQEKYSPHLHERLYMNYRFEHDWFSNNIENLTKIFKGYSNPNPPRILEIGSLEGRSSVWFLDNIPESRITCVDTWAGGKDHSEDNPEIHFGRIKSNFDYNVSKFGNRVEPIQSTSFQAMTWMITEGRTYDFIYIDGSHTAEDVNLDMILAFKLMKPGSVIYADDYYWGFADQTIYDSPKLGIDSFVNVYADRLQPLHGLGNNGIAFMKVKE